MDENRVDTTNAEIAMHHLCDVAERARCPECGRGMLRHDPLKTFVFDFTEHIRFQVDAYAVRLRLDVICPACLVEFHAFVLSVRSRKDNSELVFDAETIDPIVYRLLKFGKVHVCLRKIC